MNRAPIFSKRYVMAGVLLIINIILIVMLVMLLSSCDNKNLFNLYNIDSVKVRVVFDWRDAPDADPKGMVLYFYPEEEDGIDTGGMYYTQRFDLHGKEGGEISLLTGRYRVIAYNNDTEVCTGNLTDAFHTHILKTGNAKVTDLAEGFSIKEDADTPRPGGTEDEDVVAQPDDVWGCTGKDIVIEENQDNVITLYPHDLICHYSYEVKNVKGLQNVANACAVITGMSPTINLSTEIIGSTGTTLPLAAAKYGESAIQGEFLTFGHPDGNANQHRFGLYVWMRNGKGLFFGKDEERFDVTAQIDNATDRRRVHFVIDSIDIGDEAAGSGFQPDFGNWDEELKDIPI